MPTTNTAYENARICALAGIPVFPSGGVWRFGQERFATTDLRILEKYNSIDPNACWLAVTGPENGFVVLQLSRARDLDMLQNDFGVLVPTLSVARETGSGAALWFRVPADADIALGQKINATQGLYRKNAVLPGNKHLQTGEVFEVLGGWEFDLELMAWLPKGWIDGAPKTSPGITSTVVTRHEWQPPRISDW